MDRGTQVDVLVNNAGIGLYGPLADQDPNALATMVELNVTALTSLTRLALPGMRERRWGRILNVASVVGYQPGGPGMAAYYASKAYVLSFSKGLAREMVGTGVTVTALSPGTTATAFEGKTGASASRLYRWLPGLPAEVVARAGCRGMKRGVIVVLPGLMAKLVAFAGSHPGGSPSSTPTIPIACAEIAPQRSRERRSLKSSQPRSAVAAQLGRA